MYKQMSDTSLLMELFTSLFVKHPMRYDIGGDDASVQAITKEQLEDCYRRNYHPQRMLLVGVTAKDPRFVMEIRNQYSINRRGKQMFLFSGSKTSQ